MLRDSEHVVPAARLDDAWTEPAQRRRALAGLLADGLVVVVDGGYALPG